MAGALPAPAEHLVAGGEAGDVDPDLGDDPGQVGALAGGKFRAVFAEFALADRRLAGVDPGRPHLDHDVFLADLAKLDVAHREDVETPVLVELDRAWHEARSTRRR